jgi:hypothetical protein
MRARHGAATGVLVAALVFFRGTPASANPGMQQDFQGVTEWLSHEISQGLGFNAGSTFDPPREVLDKRLQPDLSLGVGRMPLDKTKFPVMKTKQLQEADPQSIFPAAVTFPNLVMHLRGGLPWRMDFAIRAANMTSPPGYKISAKTTAKAQSNSVGFTLRRHLLGGDLPLLSLGAHYNHVYGRFLFNTRSDVNNVQGFTAGIPIEGTIAWNVNSYGLNSVLSQRFGVWTPFFGVGYNYLTGSVRTRLAANPETDLIDPIIGEASAHPEQSQARVIFGTEMERSWVNLFFNGEVKAIGIGAGKSWIVHFGMSLPFHIGVGKGTPYASTARMRPVDPSEGVLRDAVRDAPARVKRKARPEQETSYPVERRSYGNKKEMYGGTPASAEPSPTLIFIQ